MMWVVAHLPFALQMRIGRGVGLLSYRFAKQRRLICEVNLRLCFPELTEAARQQLVKDTFIANGMGLIEIGICWYRNIEDFRDRVTVVGLEHLEKAKAQGRGVLLLCAHFSTLELGGCLTNMISPMDVTYRHNKNPLFQAAMLKGRRRHFPHVLEREDVRGVMRSSSDRRRISAGPSSGCHFTQHTPQR